MKTATLPQRAPAPPRPESLGTIVHSPALGELMTRLASEQAEIDRRRQEEIARLRAMQDRD